MDLPIQSPHHRLQINNVGVIEQQAHTAIKDSQTCYKLYIIEIVIISFFCFTGALKRILFESMWLNL